MAGNGFLKRMEMAGMAGNGYKWWEVSGKKWSDWKRLKMAGHCLKCLEWLKVAGSCWK